jgi:uncharacterized protein (DUF305 family)
MDRKLHLTLLGGTALAGLIACAAVAGPAQEAHKGHATGHTPSMQLHRIMMNHPSDMPMTGGVDRDFASMMQMHHEQAIAMIDVLLAQGDDEALKAMARKMKQQQLQEIAELEKHD